MKNLRMIVKISVIATFLLLLSFTGFAQNLNEETFSIPLSEPTKPGKLELYLIDGSIKVIGYDKNVVEVTAKRRGAKKPAKTREGMKSISNNSIEFSVEEHKNTVQVRSQMLNNGGADFTIRVPKNFSLNLRTINRGDIYVENVQGEFEVSNTNGAITMKDISGSVLADAMNRDITINFISVNNNPMAFSNLNGDIDVTFPGNFKADIKAKTQSGEVYTDFDIKLSSSDNPKVSTNNKSGVYKVTRNEWVRGSLNGGGPEVQFQSYNGDIIIRNKDK